MKKSKLNALSSRILAVSAVGLWATSVGLAIDRYMRWETTPGSSGSWKTSPPTPRKAFRLVMVAHPGCPCTSASLKVLGRLMADCRADLDAEVKFVGYDACAVDESANARLARTIPGLAVSRCDEDEATRSYGALTSGQVYLFDSKGVVRFCGGLTDTRAQEGPSSAEAAIRRIFSGLSAAREYPVFGCELSSFGGGE